MTSSASSPPASSRTTLCPACARLQATGAPPAPEPTTMYSTGASGLRAIEADVSLALPQERLILIITPASRPVKPIFRSPLRASRSVAHAGLACAIGWAAPAAEAACALAAHAAQEER